MSQTHELKTWPEFYEPVQSGNKNFDVRKADRDYKVGDTLLLREWSPQAGNGSSSGGDYTGRECERLVTFRLNGGQWGIQKDYCILGLGFLSNGVEAREQWNDCICGDKRGWNLLTETRTSGPGRSERFAAYICGSCGEIRVLGAKETPCYTHGFTLGTAEALQAAHAAHRRYGDDPLIDPLNARIAELERLAASDDFWRNWVFTEGEPNAQQIRAELADFRDLIDRVCEVYCHVTGGILSKPTYPAKTVCDHADTNYARIYEDIEKGVQHIQDWIHSGDRETDLDLQSDQLGTDVCKWITDYCDKIRAENDQLRNRNETLNTALKLLAPDWNRQCNRADALRKKLREIHLLEGTPYYEDPATLVVGCRVCNRSTGDRKMTVADHAPECLAWGREEA